MTKLSEIVEGVVVGIYYTLKDSSGEVIDTNRKGGEPMFFLQGAGNVVKGLDLAVVGKKKNDFFELEIAPEDGYGVRSEEAIRKLPRSVFPEDAPLEAGQRFTAQDDQGRMVPGMIVEVVGDEVTVDHNHPLAGLTLFFEITITGIRDATEEERTHGHPHGPGGHHH